MILRGGITAAGLLVWIGALFTFSAAPASAVHQNGLPAATTISYGPNPYETVTIYESPDAGAPLAILVHGGGFTSSVAEHGSTRKAAQLLQKHNITAMDVNYTDASGNPPAIPTEVADVVAGTDWALENASAYNVDESRGVTVIGGSAGSTLVGLAVAQLPPSVRIITLSGDEDYTLSDANGATMATGLGCSSSCSMATEEQYSPAFQAPCPSEWLIFNSTEEQTPLDQAESLESHLESLGCTSELVEIPGSAHAFSYFAAESDEILPYIKNGGLP